MDRSDEAEVTQNVDAGRAAVRSIAWLDVAVSGLTLLVTPLEHRDIWPLSGDFNARAPLAENATEPTADAPTPNATVGDASRRLRNDVAAEKVVKLFHADELVDEVAPSEANERSWIRSRDTIGCEFINRLERHDI
jgi:hypothetical protein